MSGQIPKVSVILPVYGVEQYIERCILSLQNQTLKDIEMIFIDDCGPDNSIKIAEEYAKKDDRIKILYNEQNSGAGKSRNKGIDAATGEFIGFVDPDDWVDARFYEVLYNRAKSGDYDIVKANRIAVTYRENGEIRYKKSDVNNRIMSNLKEMKPLYAYFTSEHQTAIYNTKMCQENGIYNGSTSHSENSVFLIKASYYARRFCIESGVAYYYFQREDSSVHVMDYKKFSGELESFKEQMQFAGEVLKDDPQFVNFLDRKVSYLLRRYNELKKIPELSYFCPEFVSTLCDELDAVPNKEKLRKNGRKMGLLLDHEVKKFIFVSNHEKLIESLKSKEKSVKNLAKKIRPSKPANAGNSDWASRFDFGDKELYYLQSFRGSIIFTKKFLEIDPVFAKNYINAFTKNNSMYNCCLEEDSELYKEHIEKMNAGELCWRYTKRFGHISAATILLDEDGDLFMKGEILGSEKIISDKNFYIHPQADRKIIDGKVLKDYIVKKSSQKEILGELIQYLDYLFEYFASENPDELTGLSYDAFPYNCIIQEGHKYQLFDLEFEYKENLDKGYMIFKCVSVIGKAKQEEVYFKLCEHYGVVPKWEYWERFNFRIWMETVSEPDDVPANQENVKLFEKYFLK